MKSETPQRTCLVRVLNIPMDIFEVVRVGVGVVVVGEGAGRGYGETLP